jgi:hypothetical protein
MKRGVLFEVYADRWVGEQGALVRAGALKPSTFVDYKGAVENHLKPFFEGLRLDEMTRADVRAFTTAKVERALRARRICGPPPGRDPCAALDRHRLGRRPHPRQAQPPVEVQGCCSWRH